MDKESTFKVMRSYKEMEKIEHYLHDMYGASLEGKIGSALDQAENELVHLFMREFGFPDDDENLFSGLLDIITSDNNIESIYKLLSDYQFSYLHESD